MNIILPNKHPLYLCTMAKKLVFALALLYWSMTMAVAEQEGTERERLLLLDKQVDKAYYDTLDTQFLNKILSDHFIYFHSGSYPIQSKSEALEKLYPFDWERKAMDVHIYGDTAIVAGFITIGATNTFKHLKYHMLRVYTREDIAWKLSAQHVTLNLGEDKGLWGDVIKQIQQKPWLN